MFCLGNEPRSFCHFWDCTQVWHFRLLLTMKASPSLLRDSCPCKRGNLLQSCLTLCDTMDCSSPGISVHGIFQARISSHFDSASSFFIELFLHSSPVAYWTPTNLGAYLPVSYIFAFLDCSWGSWGKNNEVVCHSILQWTTFCQNSSPWPIILSGPAWHGSKLHWITQGCDPCDHFC